MKNYINPISYFVLALLLFLILSDRLFPIEGLAIVYKYRLVLAILYVVLRVWKHFLDKEKN